MFCEVHIKDVVIRVDSSAHIGSGHVMRCLVLGSCLKDSGCIVQFATRGQPSDLNDLIEEKGFKIINLTRPKKFKVPNNSSDYSSWLQVTEDFECKDFLEKVTYADLVIVDHYGINIKWHQQVKKSLKCTLMVIDDLVRPHKADIVLDQTLNRQSSEYTSYHPCLALTGTDYALLKPDFASAREVLKKQPRLKHNILISMGGIDKPNASLSVLTALLNEEKILPVTVLLSQRSPNYEQVKSFALKHSEWVEHIEFVDDMPALMSQFSIMIGAPGSTSWERACLGIPSIVVPIADNQNTIAQQLEQANAVKVVGLNDITADLSYALQEIITQWESYSRHNLALCDGLGCKRTIQQLNRFIKTC